MKCAMTFNPEEKYDLVHGLCKLFAEIDINGDKKMEWSEFAQYVIEAVMQNPVKKKMNGELPNQNELLEQAHSQAFNRFAQSKNFDRCIHEGTIQKATYYPTLDRILLIEAKTHCIKLVGSDLQKKEVIDLYDKNIDVLTKERTNVEDGRAKEESYFVISASYAEKDEMVLSKKL